MRKFYFVYILSNKNDNVLYVGVTRDLQHRVWEHKNKVHEGFTSKYNVDKLVYYEEFESAYDAICREKQLKNWKRIWKIELIEKINPEFEDISREWY